MLPRPRLLAWLGVPAMLAGCSLTTELTGFSGGQDDGKRNEDGGTIDSSEGGVPTDGGTSDVEVVEAGTSDAAGGYVFSDDFNRQDDFFGIGNGWQEKVAAFAIQNNTAMRLQSAGSENYRNNVASRPEAESVLDVDVSTKFRFMMGSGGWVQVHARVQTATLTTNNTLDSYIFFRNLDVADDRTFTIARQRGTSYWVGLASLQTTSVIQTGALYRLRLIVKNKSPVQLTGIVEMFGANGATKEVGRVSVTDTDPARIQTPGVVAISSGNDPSGSFLLDDFEARGL